MKFKFHHSKNITTFFFLKTFPAFIVSYKLMFSVLFKGKPEEKLSHQ